MTPFWNMMIALFAYVIIAAGSYMMGRMDENRKWATIWFNQWRTVLDAQGALETRLISLVNQAVLKEKKDVVN